jgi:hypothetical protein
MYINYHTITLAFISGAQNSYDMCYPDCWMKPPQYQQNNNLSKQIESICNINPQTMYLVC